VRLLDASGRRSLGNPGPSAAREILRDWKRIR
jgi:hypothetical protein